MTQLHDNLFFSTFMYIVYVYFDNRNKGRG